MQFHGHGDSSNNRCARSFLAMELGDGPLPDAGAVIDAPFHEHAELKTRIAFHSEQFDGLQFGAD